MDTPGYRFSDDPLEMDRPLVHEWLSTRAYWALGRSREIQEAAMDGSLNFGMFDLATGAQVAFARVITDGVTFAWVCDVFVDEGARGQGLGTRFVAEIFDRLERMNLRRTVLATADAHGLYAKFGFGPLTEPAKWMAR